MVRVTTHPGEVLREEFMKPLGISDRALAAALGVSRYRVAAVRRERRGVDADTAIRLGRYFGTSAEFWINMQAAQDLSRAEGNHRGIDA
ncbi:HigA family addiction module antitoxin [Oryzibacter oryziterrae]|uniref:HigA family addiction module antitoxin n=1 Tax=Oryzibacter oryziterrae TaxID=2766474 RepID=UPI001F022CB6|nr:HigA family addiction module antitoxin [Oryzibacter oryziterrae]